MKKNPRAFFLSTTLAMWAALSLSTASAATPQGSPVTLQAQPFELSRVRLLDGPFRSAMLRNQDYLLSLEPARFLHTFKLNAGLSSTAQPYGGWEEPKCEVRGHSLGHYLSACALQFAATGDTRFKSRVDTIVSELAQCQAALAKTASHPGYLSAYPESFIDRVEAGKPVWAPYYTLHKIMAGLLDAYQYCDNQQALKSLEQFADWVKFRMDRLSPEQQQLTLRNEFGGMNDVLVDLYGVTRNPEHLRLARIFDHKSVFDPLARKEDRLDGLHANTQIPKFIGAARDYQLTGSQRYHDIATYSWERVAQHRSYVIGGHSDREHFFPTNQWAKHLSAETTETCNTYNMLKLTHRIFAWEPSVPLMDFFERGLYNHILASQDPSTGMYTYLVPLKHGHFKTYSKPHDSFWCCVGTGMENHTRYGEAIYAHGPDTFYLNLFIASELDWKEKEVQVRQETQFPESTRTKLTFTCARPQKMTVKVRWPAWTESPEVKVNGKLVSITGRPGQTYIPVEREWKTSDVLEVDLPMSLRTETLPGETNLVAVLYGPLVLAGELGTEGIESLSPYIKGQLDLARVPTPPTPVFISNNRDVLSAIQPVPGKSLTFETKKLGRPRDVTLVPFYQLHHQRYSVYWPVYTEVAWEQETARKQAIETARRVLDSRSVDVVFPGMQQSENDHGFKGESTQAGPFNERNWRHATDGGWFSYDFKGAPDQKLSLLCTYWGGDGGPRVFDILVEGEKITTQTLAPEKPGEFVQREYPIPANVTRGKSRLTVKFQAQPGKLAGGVFEVRLVKTQ